MEMLGGVLILRRVAAADVAAFQTQAQVNPGVAHFQAFLAAVRVRFHRTDLIEVRASWHLRASFENRPDTSSD
jgi:hypothetical protein